MVLSDLKTVSSLVQDLERNVLQTISPKDLQAKDRYVVVMEIAYNHLPQELKDCAKYLSMFPGSFHEEAGEAILHTSPWQVGLLGWCLLGREGFLRQ